MHARLNIVVICALCVAGCDREERKFHGDASVATSVSNVQQSEIVPGLPPTTQPAASASPTIDFKKFERNAFQLSEGQRLYTQMNCGTCHAAAGGGDIGPTLSDDSWIYGHEPQQIHATIIEGRPNGMPAYGPKLSRSEVWQLTAFVRSLSGLIPKTIAPGREDHMQTGEPPNSLPAPEKEHQIPSGAAGKNEGSK